MPYNLIVILVAAAGAAIAPFVVGPRREDRFSIASVVRKVLWVLLAGYWLAAAYAIAGVVCLLSRFVREYGGASFRMAPYMLWPFGATVTTRAVRTFYEGFSTFFWFVACSWWLTALHYVCGALLYVTVIGRPLGLACFRLAPVAFHGPAGRHVAWTWETGADVEVPWS